MEVNQKDSYSLPAGGADAIVGGRYLGGGGW